MNIKKIFGYLFPVVLILNGYSSGIGGLSLGTITLAIFYIITFILLLSNKTIKLKKKLIIVILLISIAFILKQDFSSQKIEKIIKILYFYYFILIGSSIISGRKIKEIIIKYGVLFTSYLLIQVVFWKYLNYYLPNLFLLKPLYEVYSGELYKNYVLSINYLRPASFFSEPAMYSNFMLLAICFELFDNFQKYRWKVLIFFSLGILLSTSTAGILSMILIYIYYFRKKIFQNKWKIIIIILVFLFSVEKIEIENKTYNYTKNKIFNIKKSARIGKSFENIDLDFTKKSFYIGEKEKLIEREKYLNSITDLYIDYGIVGIIIWMYFLFIIYKEYPNDMTKILILIYILKCFSSGIMFNLYGILIFLGIFSSKKLSKI